MLESSGTIDINLTIEVTSEDYWSSWTEFNNSFRSVYPVSISVFIEVGDDWTKIVDLQIPDLYTTIICNGREAGRGIRRPLDIIDLITKHFSGDLVTHKLGRTRVLGVPDSNGPIIGAR